MILEIEIRLIKIDQETTVSHHIEKNHNIKIDTTKRSRPKHQRQNNQVQSTS